MSQPSSTIKDSADRLSDGEPGRERVPGLVLVFSCGTPATVVVPMTSGEIELGRAAHGLPLDPRMSRRHIRVNIEGHRFFATDLGSQNGSAADGEPISPNQRTEVQRVLRVGDSLLVPLRDITPLARHGVKVKDGRVIGPTLHMLLIETATAARFGNALHITGESGTGKEFIARSFHEAGPNREGRFVPVNCAAIPQGLAERLLFGTRRGAYSGADADAEGYIQAAAAGTLFLDEVGDLDLSVQAKLLRVLETKELLPLGAVRSRTIELQVCSATNKDLKSQDAAGRFREDLYYRIGRPVVSIPPLRKRPEEIAWLVDAVARRITSTASLHISLIEACLLRPWPGNVRELLVEIRSAAQTALSHDSPRIEARHLAAGAGTALNDSGVRASSDFDGLLDAMSQRSGRIVQAVMDRPSDRHSDRSGERSADRFAERLGERSSERSIDPAERARIEAALRSHRGNVSGAARALGLHRTQLRRLLERHGLDPHCFADSGPLALDGDDY
ncbi:MAG TPA: sigma 54-interacting transcriptional regulator [Pseudomonadota bacterium]|nr:sigma 54-interacting transcriptional regulator [Pseudomonadota bacterium]